MPMQDLNAPPRTSHPIDKLLGQAYNSLVTKDTIVKHNDPEGSEGLGEVPDPAHELESVLAVDGLRGAAGRRARFLAVLEGSIAASDYVQEIVERVDLELAPRFSPSGSFSR
jgi:hypothetical protein